MIGIISSRLQTPDGTVLHSQHRHNYVTHTDANGKEYMLDGGCEYIRCSDNGDEKLLTVYTDDDHEVIRESAVWGTYGKDGHQPFKYVTVSQMSTEHLQACLDTQKKTMRPAMYKVMQNELEYRDES